ncbi:MAG TPA: hypothetical protein VFD33_04365, partial [Bacillota bacterium]|nr:hypothetical protein [Bacillota bacterium]
MGKKKKRRRTKKNKALHEIIGVLIVSIGIFSGLSVYFPHYAGAVGLFLSGGLKGLFGLAAYIMPIVIMSIGVLTIIMYRKKVNKTKLVLSIITVLLVFGLVHILFFNKINTSSFDRPTFIEFL